MLKINTLCVLCIYVFAKNLCVLCIYVFAKMKCFDDIQITEAFFVPTTGVSTQQHKQLTINTLKRYQKRVSNLIPVPIHGLFLGTEKLNLFQLCFSHINKV
jgi:hypothetical protein